MSDLKRTDEILRDTIYDWLHEKFATVNRSLNPEMRTELDGILYKLAEQLCDAGMWKALQDACGVRFEEFGARGKAAHS